MTKCFEIINLNKTSTAKLTCLFSGSGHTTPDLDLDSQPCLMWFYNCSNAIMIHMLCHGENHFYSYQFDQDSNFSVGENEYIVTQVSSHKLLGIHVESTHSWKTHITHLCSKLRSRPYLCHCQ